jgi:hypothetical protein
MPVTWKAPTNVLEMLAEVKEKYHGELADASIVVTFTDSKPFVKNRFNWGSVKKFSEANKIWFAQKHDLCIDLCSEVWHSVLDNRQREALLDLHLSRCAPEYEPEEVVENGKKKVVKDEFGRVKYTQTVKLDDEGNPKWVISPLDLTVFTSNVRRYGLWCPELDGLREAIQKVGTDESS